MYVCVCNAVTDGQIREAAHRGCRSFSALRDELQVGTCCGRCSGCARRVLQDAISDPCATSTLIARIATPLVDGLATPQPASTCT